MDVRAFATTADLAIAIALVAVTLSTLRRGERPRRVRSWLFFAAASVALMAHAVVLAFDAPALAALSEVCMVALFAVGVVLLYGTDRETFRAIEQHAERDPTTGLFNRRAFRELVAVRLSRHDRADAAALAIIDLDGFKQVNDLRGHLEGDRILELVATAIRINLRARDIACRYGGDEFLVFLDGCTTDDARRILQRVRTIIATVTGTAGSSVTASIGVALSTDIVALDTLVAIADRTLIDVKRSGKDQLRVAEGFAS